jgi:ubiquinone/menaquinone biosynthesis C-methylase UbiE
LIELDPEDQAAWGASGLGEEAYVDWLTDRIARKPSGARARATYGAEDVHVWAREAILEALALDAGDRLLEIGCGGGLLLRDAAATGASVTGIDHSEEMVALARANAPAADVLLASAEQLPFADATFTAIAMSVVFFFFSDPVGVLRECLRVAAPGARLAVYTIAPELRGTRAAPEPLASRGFFHTDDELVALAGAAGWRDTRVRSRDGGQLLTGCA